MKSAKQTILEPVITQDDKVDLSHASYNEHLSLSDMDEENQTFCVSIDRVMFKKLTEIAHRVLSAGGYLVNLENTLAILDSLTIGSRVKLNVKDLAVEKPQVKQHIPTLQMRLPAKNRVGDLLGLFYDEIKNYEEQIERLTLAQSKSAKNPEDDPQQLLKQHKKLLDENENLKAKLGELLKKNAQYEKLQKDVSRAFAEQNVLPPTLRLAEVKEVNLKERFIQLKSGRTSFSLPLALAAAIPMVHENCLVKIVDGDIKNAYFFEEKGTPLQPRLAEVVYARDGVCKIRDHARQEYIQTATNDAERMVVRSLKRGQKILAYFFDKELLSFSPLGGPLRDDVVQYIQEALVYHQLTTLGSDQRAKEITTNKKVGK